MEYVWEETERLTEENIEDFVRLESEVTSIEGVLLSILRNEEGELEFVLDTNDPEIYSWDGSEDEIGYAEFPIFIERNELDKYYIRRKK